MVSKKNNNLKRVVEEMDNESNMKYHLRVVQQKLKAADLAYEAKQAAIRQLRESWQDGSLEMTRGQFQDETKRLEEEIDTLLVERVQMRTSTNQLAAKEVDIERWNKLAHAEDWSYIDLLASRLKEPSGSMKNPRNPDKQAHWRKAIMKAYGAEKSDKKIAWCPITQRYEHLRMVTAAHIVRYNVTEPAAVHLFGATDGSHIWSIKNGIPLFVEYEEMLEDAIIAIVPTNNSRDLMVVVLDEAEPMRYLYFCFAMNLLRRQKFEVDGWWRDRLEYADTPFFPSPGKWVRETTLRKLAIRIGHLPTNEANDFVAISQGSWLNDPFQEGEDEEKDEVFASILQYTYQDRAELDPAVRNEAFLDGLVQEECSVEAAIDEGLEFRA